jgi:hypothetical protein
MHFGKIADILEYHNFSNRSIFADMLEVSKVTNASIIGAALPRQAPKVRS